MIDHDKAFEKECEEYLLYLYELAARKYGDCDDIDEMVQDCMMALIVRERKGIKIDHPKGFLSAVLKNKYNSRLRQKYRNNIVSYENFDFTEQESDPFFNEEADARDEEYASTRRELGRLISIYREVAVRYYVHGHSVERIAKDLNISQGTVKSRLSTARDQIREGLENMEKYSNISYEPKKVSIAIWGGDGMGGEPFSLVTSPVAKNVLVLAYEKPISIRDLADTMGMPAAYIEPHVEALIQGELMSKTDGGLVYTRCFVQKHSESFGDIQTQEKLADKYAEKVWEIAEKHLEPLNEREEFAAMNEKQKVTLMLFAMYQTLADVVEKCRPATENMPKDPPERPNGGRWLAQANVFEPDEGLNKYDRSGPVSVCYSAENDGMLNCKMFDLQTCFGDTHWMYGTFKYKCQLQSILRFYASFLPSGVKTDKDVLNELIPEFEKLHILKRREDGEIVPDIPALTFEESAQHFDPAMDKMKTELFDLLHAELEEVWANTKNKVPKYVDGRDYYLHTGALGAYVVAQLLAITEKKLLPYPVTVGETPIIFVQYKRSES